MRLDEDVDGFGRAVRCAQGVEADQDGTLQASEDSSEAGNLVDLAGGDLLMILTRAVARQPGRSGA